MVDWRWIGETNNEIEKILIVKCETDSAFIVIWWHKNDSRWIRERDSEFARPIVNSKRNCEADSEFIVNSSSIREIDSEFIVKSRKNEILKQILYLMWICEQIVYSKWISEKDNGFKVNSI